MTSFRFGILGTGNIARQFAEGVAGSRHCAIHAVASRSVASAHRFAETHGIERAHAYGSYAELLDDPDLDGVYVALPNTMHHEWTIRACEAGLHVLCEKPLAVSREQAVEMFDAARSANRLLMEAFMYRCHPQTRAVVHAMRSGAIGTVKQVRTSFCYRTKNLDDNIRFDAGLAGGAMMDIGCYCVDFARLIAGEEPDEIVARSVRHASGVDERTTGMLRFPGGVDATFACAMTMQADNTAWILGDEGYLEVPVPWKPAERGAVWRWRSMTPPRQDAGKGGGKGEGKGGGGPFVEEHTEDADAPLFGLEADAFATAARGEAEPMVSEADSLGNAAVLDAVREMTRDTA